MSSFRSHVVRSTHVSTRMRIGSYTMRTWTTPFLLLIGWMSLTLCLCSCTSTPSETPDEATVAQEESNHIDGQASTIGDRERLSALYMPSATPKDMREETQRTDGSGQWSIPVTLSHDACLDLLVSSQTGDTFEGKIILVADYPDGKTPETSVTRQEIMAYDRGHASAWILPHLCPDRDVTARLYGWGAPAHDVRIERYTMPSSTEDRALFRQGRRDLPGFRGYGPVQFHTLAHDMRTSVPLAVSATRCIAIVAYAGDGLDDVDAEFIDLAGERFALEVATDRASVLGPWCPRRDGVVRVSFRAYEGQGNFRWQRWEANENTGKIVEEISFKSADGKRTRRDIRRVWSTVLPRAMMREPSDNPPHEPTQKR